MKKEAMLYRPAEGGSVQCLLCSHYCVIAPGRTGTCRVRRNEDGKLFSSVYARISAAAVDPVEKKPLYHFLPASLSFSVATVGCNFKCRFCQNAHLSQPASADIPARLFSPASLLEEALSSGAASLSYTYSEPTVFFETAYDVGRLARKRGLKNIFVTNGFMSAESHACLAEFLDAANVDLKAFSDDTYRNVMGGRLQPVLDNIARLRRENVHVEVTTLLVPGLNDSREELRDIARFLVSVDKSIPWHVSRFHPDYRMTDRPPTPVEDVIRAADTGKEEGLEYVYTGNMPGQGREDTLCVKCGETLIRRRGYEVRLAALAGGACGACGHRLPGVFKA